jgi:hypothetical protein
VVLSGLVKVKGSLRWRDKEEEAKTKVVIAHRNGEQGNSPRHLPKLFPVYMFNDDPRLGLLLISP